MNTRKTIYDGRHPSIAAALLDIAKVHSSLGHHEEAINNLEPALDIYAEYNTRGSTGYAACLCVASVACAHLGFHEKAVDIVSRALAMCKKLYKTDHPNIALAL